MKWNIQVDLFRAGGGITSYTATLTRDRPPQSDEVIRISGLNFPLAIVRQTDVDTWQAISRTNVATAPQLRKLREALVDGGFQSVGRQWRR